MANYDGNTNISEYGKASRFGAKNGPDPRITRQCGLKPWSIRNAMRRIAAMEYQQAEALIKNKKKMAILSMAEITALNKFLAAIRGNVTAMQQVTDDVDGRLKKAQVSIHKVDEYPP